MNNEATTSYSIVLLISISIYSDLYCIISYHNKLTSVKLENMSYYFKHKYIAIYIFVEKQHTELPFIECYIIFL